MIQFNPDGSGLLILDSDPTVRVPFASGISPSDLLAMQTAFNVAHAPVPTVVLTQATIDAIFAGAAKMTDVRQFGADYLTGVKNMINAIEAMRVMRERTVSDPTLFASYLASPGARTDLQLIDLQNADAALVQVLFTFDSGAPTNKSELFKLL